MKEVHLQFPSAETLGEFIRIVDVPAFEANNKLLTLLCKLTTSDIEFAIRTFSATVLEFKTS